MENENNMNKKKLYKNIMLSVSKEVKKALNEGAWGYGPDKSDDFLDECAKLGRQFLSIIVKNFEKSIKEKDYQQIWNYMGVINDYLRTHYLSGECLFWDEKEGLYTTVNSGQKNEECRLNYGIKLNQLFNQAYDMLNIDENILDYSDFSKFKLYLNEIKKQYDKLMLERKFGDGSHDYLHELNNKRDKLFYKYIEKD